MLYIVPLTCSLTYLLTDTVLWLYPALVKTSCTLNVKYFPFDTQQCNIVFISLPLRRNATEVQRCTDQSFVTGFRPLSATLTCCRERFPSLTDDIPLPRSLFTWSDTYSTIAAHCRQFFLRWTVLTSSCSFRGRTAATSWTWSTTPPRCRPASTTPARTRSGSLTTSPPTGHKDSGHKDQIKDKKWKSVTAQEIVKDFTLRARTKIRTKPGLESQNQHQGLTVNDEDEDFYVRWTYLYKRGTK